MSQQLDDVATLLPLQWMSRQLTDVATSFLCFCCRDCLLVLRPQVFAIDVATLISLQADVATAYDAVLMSRPLVFSSSIHGCLAWSFCRAQLVFPSITLLLQLEFCRHDLNMNFHCCKGFTTSGSLIFVRLSCCIASSAGYISNAQPPSTPFTAKIPLSLEFPTA